MLDRKDKEGWISLPRKSGKSRIVREEWIGTEEGLNEVIRRRTK